MSINNIGHYIKQDDFIKILKDNMIESKNNDINDMGAEIMSSMLRQGKKPEEIAEIVFEAIKENIFYILSHPAWDDTLRSHYENILSRKEIQRNSEDEIAKFFSPREDGEKY